MLNAVAHRQMSETRRGAETIMAVSKDQTKTRKRRAPSAKKATPAPEGKVRPTRKPKAAKPKEAEVKPVQAATTEENDESHVKEVIRQIQEEGKNHLFKEIIDRCYKIAKSRLEIARTAYDVAQNQLKSAKAERSVTAEQLDEGEVLAPTSGRVLAVPVTNGAVILPGESIADIATRNYILRLELPERHARFISKGDKVLLGERGLSPNGAVIGEGTITQVYPKLKQGRVIADVTARGLGDYFVGERVRVLISAGKRSTYAIPRDYTFKRYGLDYVKLARKGAGPLEIVVQLGLPLRGKGQNNLVEVLAGLNAGDVLVKP